MLILNKIYNKDCIQFMKERLPDNYIDLVVTSPPYNVNIPYDEYKDDLQFDEYMKFTNEWLSEIYRTLKPDGRIALNIPYECKMKGRGGRIFMLSEYWQIMKLIGFNFAGVIDLVEDHPHRVKTFAYGSFMSPRCPYIYNPKEVVVIAYKNVWAKEKKGRTMEKDRFIELASGSWKYNAETRKITKANFSLDLPIKAVEILSFPGEIVYDPFMGGGTTAIACIELGRQYLGTELSKYYCFKANARIKTYINKPEQGFIEF